MNPLPGHIRASVKIYENHSKNKKVFFSKDFFMSSVDNFDLNVQTIAIPLDSFAGEVVSIEYTTEIISGKRPEMRWISYGRPQIVGGLSR